MGFHVHQASQAGMKARQLTNFIPACQEVYSCCLRRRLPSDPRVNMKARQLTNFIPAPQRFFSLRVQPGCLGSASIGRTFALNHRRSRLDRSDIGPVPGFRFGELRGCRFRYFRPTCFSAGDNTFNCVSRLFDSINFFMESQLC